MVTFFAIFSSVLHVCLTLQLVSGSLSLSHALSIWFLLIMSLAFAVDIARGAYEKHHSS